MIKVFKPYVNVANIPGDSFRELVDVWGELNLCEVIKFNGEKRWVWFGGIGEYMLFENDLVDWQWEPNEPKKGVLFGNQRIPGAQPWIFWARHPRILEKVKQSKPPILSSERKIKSVFLGRIENSIQANKRLNYDYSKYIEEFDIVNGIQVSPLPKYKYPHEEYLEVLRNSKFGLCLAGTGPKCNRDIELMALGVIPIVTPNVDIIYYNPWIENEHYISIKDPKEIPDKINSLSDKKINEMSKACIDWYEKTCSPNSSFNITKYIVDNSNLFNLNP